MAASLRELELHRSNIVQIADVRCRPRECCAGKEEYCPQNTIVFPRAGFFVRRIGGREIAADPNTALFFRCGESHRVSHPVQGGDDCTTLIFPTAVLGDAFATYDRKVLDHPERPFRISRAEYESGTFLAMQTLRASLRASSAGGSDWLAFDEAALRLLDLVAKSVSRQSNAEQQSGARRTQTLRAHRDLIESTRAVLAGRMAEKLTLTGLARLVHSSPFHLARIFRRVTGITIHRYLTGLRLRVATERLADGESDLTRLALSLGFCSHSHFTDSFQREFGRPPANLRKLLSQK